MVDVTTPSEIAYNLNQRKVKMCLQSFCPNLITDDVMNNSSFTSGMVTSLPPIQRFMEVIEDYDKNISRSRMTSLQSIVSVARKNIDAIKLCMVEASHIKFDLSQGTQILSKSATRKNAMLTNILALSLANKRYFEKERLLYKIKKRMDQVKEKVSEPIKAAAQNEISFSCLNAQLSWENAYCKFDTTTPRNLPPGTTALDIRHSATRIEEDVCVPVDGEFKQEISLMLQQHFPVMAVNKNNNIKLYNVSELILHTDLMLTEDKPGQVEEIENEENKKGDTFIGPRRKRGRKPLWEQFPTLLEETTSFIKGHSFMAHGRRRETTGTGFFQIYFFHLLIFDSF